MASLDSKVKQANLLGKAVEGVNKITNESFAGNIVNNYGLARDIGKGLIWDTAKNHNFLGMGNKMKAVEKDVTGVFKRLPKPVQGGLKKLDKGMDFAFNKVQLPAFFTDLGVNKLTNLGGGKEIEAIHQQKAFSKQLEKVTKPPRQQGMLGDMFKDASAFESGVSDPHLEDINVREPDMYEIPHLIDICKTLAKIFLISTKRDHEQINDRMFSQNTLMSGELNDLKGFINYGDRAVKLGGPKIKYIRIIYVSPESRGNNIAAKLINSVAGHHEPAWMQISTDNLPMKKTASRLGFEKIDTWSYDGHKSEVWGRNIC